VVESLHDVRVSIEVAENASVDELYNVAVDVRNGESLLADVLPRAIIKLRLTHPSARGVHLLHKLELNFGSEVDGLHHRLE
jgi:hypothetical protein